MACSTCRYATPDPYDGGLRCTNAMSEQCTEWVDEEYRCDKWEDINDYSTKE